MLNAPLADIWDQALNLLEKDMSAPGFDSLTKSASLLAVHDETVIIGVRDDMVREWLESRYIHIIQSTLFQLLNRNYDIKFIIPPKNDYTSNKKDFFPQAPYHGAISYLNPKYTFDTFVIGNSNRFAHAASLAVAEAPAKAYNPLFIYGGVGLGKTHLMHAIGTHVLSHYPNTKVLYVSSEKFTNELINAIRDDKTVDFRNKYRNIDVLLIDDIQFLAGKERTQEEFFHTFNALHEANKQLVISSDRPPKEIPTLENRLRSRFEWGLITDIQIPELETRIAILRKKARLDNLLVPNEVMVFIANKIKSNIRELEGALIRVVAFSTLTGKPITVELAAEALKDIIDSKPKQISIALIQEVVAEYFKLKIEDFKAKKRTKAVAYPRQIAMYLSRELTDASLPKIGEEFGGRDHTTVIHGYEKIAAEVRQDPMVEASINELIDKITR